MAQIVINIPDIHDTRINNTLSKSWGYTSTVRTVDGSEIPNPENKRQFIKRTIIEYLLSELKKAEIRDLVDAISAPSPPSIT